MQPLQRIRGGKEIGKTAGINPFALVIAVKERAAKYPELVFDNRRTERPAEFIFCEPGQGGLGAVGSICGSLSAESIEGGFISLQKTSPQLPSYSSNTVPWNLFVPDLVR